MHRTSGCREGPGTLTHPLSTRSPDDCRRRRKVRRAPYEQVRLQLAQQINDGTLPVDSLGVDRTEALDMVRAALQTKTSPTPVHP